MSEQPTPWAPPQGAVTDSSPPAPPVGGPVPAGPMPAGPHGPYVPYQPTGAPGLADPQLQKDAAKVLVLGIVGLVLCGLLGIAAVWEGSKLRRRTDAAGLPEIGIAKAGRILGWVAIGWMVFAIVAAGFMVAAAPDPQSMYYTGY